MPLHMGKHVLCLRPGGKLPHRHPLGGKPSGRLLPGEGALRPGEFPQPGQQPLFRPAAQCHPPLLGKEQKQGAGLFFPGLWLCLHRQLFRHALGIAPAQALEGANQAFGRAPGQAHHGPQLHQ